jgi:hypothetical protein
VNNLYASLYWSKHYGEHARREASRRQLAKRTRALRDRPLRLRHAVPLLRRSVLAHLRRATRPAGQPIARAEEEVR